MICTIEFQIDPVVGCSSSSNIITQQTALGPPFSFPAAHNRVKEKRKRKKKDEKKFSFLESHSNAQSTTGLLHPPPFFLFFSFYILPLLFDLLEGNLYKPGG